MENELEKREEGEEAVRDPGFKARLAQVIGQQDPYPWAASLGIGKSTFAGPWRNGAIPQTKTLLKIAQHTNISLNWLLTGKGPERIDESRHSGEGGQTTAGKEEAGALPYTYLGSAYPAQTQENSTESPDLCSVTRGREGAGAPVEEMGEVYRAPWEGYCLVPRYGMRVGSGEPLRCDQVVDSLSFKVSWVEQHMGLDPRALALVNVVGDSMEPTLKERDLLLLDRRGFTRTDPGPSAHSDGIYVILRGEELVVKRLQFGFDGSVHIQSDNPIYAPQTLSTERAQTLQIVGRVVWVGRRI
ncbi:MAG: LexA family transcriptional regulator [Magnetococcales bacterium]|nr:LexA family transcriptional regulator [Magnetococcales bacterium]